MGPMGMGAVGLGWSTALRCAAMCPSTPRPCAPSPLQGCEVVALGACDLNCRRLKSELEHISNALAIRTCGASSYTALAKRLACRFLTLPELRSDPDFNLAVANTVSQPDPPQTPHHNSPHHITTRCHRPIPPLLVLLQSVCLRDEDEDFSQKERQARDQGYSMSPEDFKNHEQRVEDMVY